MQVMEAVAEVAAQHKCAMCQGHGWVAVDVLERDGIWWYESVDCPMCAGTGRAEEELV